MSYEPYPILDFGGLNVEKEPWLSPNNAWQNLQNGQSYRGQLRKREGRAHLQKLGIPVTEAFDAIPTTPATSGVKTYGGTLNNLPIVEPKDPFGTYNGTDYTIKFTSDHAGGSQSLYVGEVVSVGDTYHLRQVRRSSDDAEAGLMQFGDASGGDNGDFTAIFEFTTTTIPEAVYEYDPEEPVMGFETFVAIDGTEHHLVFNTTRCWVMDNAEERYYQEEPTLGDIWGGTVTDHFWLEQFGGIMVICNGVDFPWKYDPTLGTTLVKMSTDFDPGSGDVYDIQSAKMFINYQNIGVWLGTKEGGQFYENRARWTQVGNAEAYNNATDFLDSPSNDVIRSAGMVGPDLFVGMRDTKWWHLELRDDTNAPFKWRPIESDQGAIAEGGTVAFRDRLMSRNRYGLSEINRLGDVNAAPDLGDKAFAWSAANAYQTQAFKFAALRQAWWSYADGSDDTPLHALVMQFNHDGSRSLSVYDMPIHSYGTFRGGGAPVWDDISDVMDTITYSMDSPQNQSTFARLVGGNLIGDIYIWDERSADKVVEPGSTVAAADWQYQDQAIDFRAKSIRLNPFPNMRVRLGYVDVIVSPAVNGILEVSAYADYESAPYMTDSISLDRGTSTNEKVIHRFKFNRIATFHTIELREKTTSAVAIDYVCPWMKPVGPLREVA